METIRDLIQDKNKSAFIQGMLDYSTLSLNPSLYEGYATQLLYPLNIVMMGQTDKLSPEVEENTRNYLNSFYKFDLVLNK
jgi:hypothetical protein